MTATEIMENLYLGDMKDARHFNGVIIFVGEGIPQNEPPHAIHIQIIPPGTIPRLSSEERLYKPRLNDDYPIKVNKSKVAQAIYTIRYNLSKGRRVLVHFYVGAERSPIVVACYLVEAGYAPDIYKAYDYIMKKRPIVIMHSDWL